jgi:hypothetical protein
MKTKLSFAIRIALLLGLLVTNGVVHASGGKATPFKATYTDLLFNTLDTCSGARVTQGNGKVKDSETCVLSGDTSRVVAGTYAGAPKFCIPNNPCAVWSSDYDGQIAKTVTITITNNGDGTFTMNVVAYY